MKNETSMKKDWIIAGIFAIVSACIYFAGLADYAYPGESAFLMSKWSGLEPLSSNSYPLMAWFNRAFSALHLGQAIAPVSGVLCVVMIYFLSTLFVRSRVVGDEMESSKVAISRTCGIVATLVFMVTPAVRSAATHLDPRIFDAAWAMLVFLPIAAYPIAPKAIAWIMPIVIGAMVGVGAADSVLFLFLSPIYIIAVWAASQRRGGKGYGAAAFFIFAVIVFALVAILSAYDQFKDYADAQKDIVLIWFKPDMSFFIPLFVTLPFVGSLFAAGRSFGASRTWVHLSFHALITFTALLAIATPFAPSEVMLPTHYPPVMTSAFAAFVAGYVIAFWSSFMRKLRIVNESVGFDRNSVELRFGRLFASSFGGGFALILMISLLFDFFAKFDPDRGRFMDVVADRIIADLGDRTWFITDGTLDSHLRLAAKRASKELNLVCLQKDDDKKYIEELSKLLCDKGMNVYSERLRQYGILTFIQDWFGSDSAVAAKVAIFGAPDLWTFAPAIRPIPELMFFGGDPSRLTNDLNERREFAKVLEAPEEWGSYKLHEVKDVLDRRRLNLRRHLGFVTCNRGCFEQGEARRLQNVGLNDEAVKRDDAAFDYYELVLRELDSDNVSALFNEFELLDRKNRKALSRRKEIISKLEEIKKDENRRYSQNALGLFYGYLMNPSFIVKQGLAQVRHGNYGQGISQIRRAMDLVPIEQRDWAELNILAPLYVEGRAKDKETARKIYAKELERDPMSRVALVGLARLAMLSGENDKAIELLEKATKNAGNDPGSYIDIATLRLMRGELDEAKRILVKATDLDHANMRAWSLTAATLMRQLDALPEISDKAAREVRRKELRDELELIVIPAMEKVDPDGAAVTSAKAFMKIREGGEENLKEARRGLEQIAKTNPDNQTTGDLILGLDIQLNDREAAARRAEVALRDDPEAPLPNYVLGSIALGNGDLTAAERHLKLAVETKKFVPMAINDFAECLRQMKKYEEAEAMARRAVAATPNLYVVWETLGTILLDAGKQENLGEAEMCIAKACDMSKDEKGGTLDPRMPLSLARVQIKLGKFKEAKRNLRIVSGHRSELEPQDEKLFQNLIKLAQ